MYICILCIHVYMDCVYTCYVYMDYVYMFTCIMHLCVQKHSISNIINLYDVEVSTSNFFHGCEFTIICKTITTNSVIYTLPQNMRLIIHSFYGTCVLSYTLFIEHASYQTLFPQNMRLITLFLQNIRLKYTSHCDQLRWDFHNIVEIISITKTSNYNTILRSTPVSCINFFGTTKITYLFSTFFLQNMRLIKQSFHRTCFLSYTHSIEHASYHTLLPSYHNV